ncbi:MAG: serine dehydratase subunit alpha family protein [Clostridium sp.]|nr:serine dehydratase subunit alpha family protein [Clostridium sp.]
MNHSIYEHYTAILNTELITALGCTEPIAIAYAGAKVREVLGVMPESCSIACSGNIIKNVKGVTVPNSGGMKGIDTAAVLGIVGGNPEKVLAVLEDITPAQIEETKRLTASGFCQCELIEGVENLYLIITARAGSETAQVEIRNFHSNITKITKNGAILFDASQMESGCTGQASVFPDKSLLNVKDILEYASSVNLEDIRPVISRQIACNTAISQEGLRNPWGVQTGRTLLDAFGSEHVSVRAKAAAAAGSDARMSGCPLPVVINSGSGNQGMTVSLPVIEYAKEYHISEERLIRALAMSNLIALHQKKYIGSLSAYCGAVSAACGAGAAIAWMLGAGYSEISMVITNTIASIGGMVCDGAKPSCAVKIASAVDCAVTALHLSRRGLCFQPGEGLVMENVEKTIESIGRMGREGMRTTDVEILNIMLGK